MSTDPVVLGLDLGGTYLKWGIVELDGRIIYDARQPLTDRSPDAVVELLSEVIVEGLKHTDRPITAVGIGTPGLIDLTGRIIRTSPNFPLWNDMTLADRLEPVTGGIPLVIENDANLLIFSETRLGKAQGIRDLVVLTLGTGVGGGAMVDGRLLRGFGGGGGELGHITIDPSGPECGCGSTGCLESYCNISGVMRTASEVYAPDDPPATPRLLAEAAAGNDIRAIRAWRNVGWALGVGVGTLINTFNPELVLIGGGVAGAGEFLLEPAREVASRRTYPQNWKEVKVENAGMGQQSGLLGAAALAYDHLGLRMVRT